jgi:hypothetical protein
MYSHALSGAASEANTTHTPHFSCVSPKLLPNPNPLLQASALSRPASPAAPTPRPT